MASWIKEHITADQWPWVIGQLTDLHLTPSKKHDGPCPNPSCGGEKDSTRFRFDNKNGEGNFWCRYCAPKGGDGIQFIRMMTGWGFRETEDRIAALIGVTRDSVGPNRPFLDPHDLDCQALWEASSPVALSDPAGIYLTRTRGLTWDRFPRHLRYYPRVKHYGDKTGLITFHPALVALVKRPGKHWTLHFTYLTLAGEKASIVPDRATMPGGKFPDGGYVELGPMGEEGGIAESIEDARSATQMTGIMCWSALNTSSMAKWTPPDGLKRLSIFGDNDENAAGQAAAWELKRRLKANPKTRHLDIEVRIPDVAGQDWNDVLVFRGLAIAA